MLSRFDSCFIRKIKSLIFCVLVLSISIDARSVEEAELEEEVEQQIQEERNILPSEDENILEDAGAPAPSNGVLPPTRPCMDFPYCEPDFG